MAQFSLIIFSLVLMSCSGAKKVSDITKNIPSASEVKQNIPKVNTEPGKEDISSVPTSKLESVSVKTLNTLPAEITGSSILEVNCVLRDDKRVINVVERSDDRGWGVVYHKFGNKKVIAIAKNDRSFCNEVVSRVKNTLETAGYQCDGDISSSSVTTETLEEESSEMVDNPQGTGTSLLDKAKEVGSSAVDAAKDTGASALDKAKDAAGAVTDAVKGE